MTSQQFIEWTVKKLNARDAGVFIKIVMDGRWTSHEHKAIRKARERQEWEMSRESFDSSLQSLIDARAFEFGTTVGGEVYKTNTIRLWNGIEELRQMGLGDTTD